MVDAMDQWVAGLPDGPWYRLTDMADMLGMSKDALKQLARRNPELGPSRTAYYGRIRVGLYNRDTYLKLMEHRRLEDGEVRHGRPKQYTAEEAVARRKIQDLIRKYRARQQRYADAGDTERSSQAAARVQELRDQLDGRKGVDGESRSRVGQPG